MVYPAAAGGKLLCMEYLQFLEVVNNLGAGACMCAVLGGGESSIPVGGNSLNTSSKN